MTDCIFCKIISGDIPSAKIYEDELVYAFRDIQPQAAVHILVVPKVHIAALGDATPAHEAVLARLMLACGEIARQEGLADGYRVVTNVGDHGCQSVKHLHYHILGGQQLSGTMG